MHISPEYDPDDLSWLDPEDRKRLSDDEIESWFAFYQNIINLYKVEQQASHSRTATGGKP